MSRSPTPTLPHFATQCSQLGPKRCLGFDRSLPQFRSLGPMILHYAPRPHRAGPHPGDVSHETDFLRDHLVPDDQHRYDTWVAGESG